MNETRITAVPDVPAVRITRELDAPPERVFRAHVGPDLLVRRLGPRGLEMRIDHYDCRTGGSYRYVHSAEDVDHGLEVGVRESYERLDEVLAV